MFVPLQVEWDCAHCVLKTCFCDAEIRVVEKSDIGPFKDVLLRNQMVLKHAVQGHISDTRGIVRRQQLFHLYKET